MSVTGNLLSMRTGNRVHAPKVRGADLYQTPVVAVQALLKLEPVPLTIWEPACGPGAIVKVLRDSGRAVVATDLIKYDCPDSKARVDFLMERKMPVPGLAAIVTNPPFKLADEFVAKALDLCPEVYMLLRVGFLEGLRWSHPDDIEEARNKRLGLDLGRHLARVHVFTPRLPMMHREGWLGPKNANSGMPFGWFVFLRDYRSKYGPSQIHWCRWRELVEQSPAEKEIA